MFSLSKMRFSDCSAVHSRVRMLLGVETVVA